MPTTLQESLNFKIDDVTVGSASTEIIKTNPYRRYLLIQNKSDEAVYMKIGESASGTEGILLAASGGTIEFSHGTQNMTRAAIHAICSSGGKGIVTVEGFEGNQSAPPHTTTGSSSSSDSSDSSVSSSNSSVSDSSESSSSDSSASLSSSSSST